MTSVFMGAMIFWHEQRLWDIRNTIILGIVAKKRDPGILDPELFFAQIRKVEPSWESSSGILGKLGKFLRLGKFIRKIGKEILRLGKLSDNIRKVEGET